MPDAEARAVEVEPGRILRAMTGGLESGKEGAPSVLYDAGAFGIYADGANVVRALAERGVASVAYTRAGLSGSDAGTGGADARRTRHRHAPPAGHARPEQPRYADRPLDGGFPAAPLRRSAPAARPQARPRRRDGPPARCPAPALHAFAASLRPVERTLPAFCRTANAYPNAMRLGGQERADKLTSVYSAAHLRATRLEVAEVARARVGTDHGVAMTLMPSGRVARGSAALAERMGARLIDMSRWGHASVLNPEGAAVIADAAIAD